jgi:hypothetical protein
MNVYFESYQYFKKLNKQKNICLKLQDMSFILIQVLKVFKGFIAFQSNSDFELRSFNPGQPIKGNLRTSSINPATADLAISLKQLPI